MCKNYIGIILINLLLGSCCDQTIQEYDSNYDNYYPEKGKSEFTFQYKHDSNKIEILKVLSDYFVTVEEEVNGDGCIMSFNERVAEIDIPNNNENSIKLRTNGNEGTLEIIVEYDSITHTSRLWEDKNSNIDCWQTDCFYDSLSINGKYYKDVMQFKIGDSTSSELNKIFIVKNLGIMQLTYKNNDTLVRN
jgi:hypothetical protein